MKIVFANGKGGVGKSTLALLIALAAKEAGRPALIKDKDPQQTLMLTLKALEFDVNPIEHCIQIMDTPPALASKAFADSVKDSDLVIVPSGPSPADVLATAATADALKSLNALKKTRLIFNRVKPNTKLSSSISSLGKRTGLISLNAFLVDRQCYQHAFLEGWKGLTKEAKEEAYKLALEVFTTKV